MAARLHYIGDQRPGGHADQLPPQPPAPPSVRVGGWTGAFDEITAKLSEFPTVRTLGWDSPGHLPWVAVSQTPVGFKSQICKGRARFLALWHEGEQPSRPWGAGPAGRHDSRHAATGRHRHGRHLPSCPRQAPARR